MKKLIGICMAAMVVFSAMVGCSSVAKETDEVIGTSNASTANVARAKVVVNFEGTVTAVNGDEIVLDNGKTVVLSDDTVFAGDPDTNNTVSEEIAVGNFIQGYTKENPDLEKVSADKIYCNIAVQPSHGKLMIDFEGKVASVDGDKITLENGQTVVVDADTVFSIAGGIVENIIISEGYNIQGCTEGDTTAAEITASRIHIITF